jgi:hypothetical protein
MELEIGDGRSEMGDRRSEMEDGRALEPWKFRPLYGR